MSYIPRFSFDEATIVQALTYIGDRLQMQKLEATIIGFNGLMGVLYFRTRTKTRDVDVFLKHLWENDNRLWQALRAAADDAEQEFGLPIGWFNTSVENEMSISYKHEGEYPIVVGSMWQNIPIFKHGGLTILAAEFAMVLGPKLTRWEGNDWEDARSLIVAMRKRDGNEYTSKEFGDIVGISRSSRAQSRLNELCKGLEPRRRWA